MKTTMLASTIALFGTVAMAQDKWTVETDTDAFTGKRRTIAMSPTTRAGRVAVRCIGERHLTVMIVFPNSIKGSYRAPIFAEIGGRGTKEIWAYHDSSGTNLFLSDGTGSPTRRLAFRLMDASSFAVRFAYLHMEGVAIGYPLAGAKEAIGKILQACGHEL